MSTPLVTEKFAAFIFVFFFLFGLRRHSIQFILIEICGMRSLRSPESYGLLDLFFFVRKMSKNRKISRAPRVSRPSGSLRNAELRNRLAVFC